MFYPIAKADPKSIRQATVDFEDSLHTVAAANCGFVQRDGILVEGQNTPVRIQEKHVEWDQRILHPESY